MNASEQFVADLCRTTFLSLWSYPNPRGKGGKELCDILVVCDPDVVIFSVKEIELKGDPDDPVNADRWRRRAVDESIKQIYGAERWIADTTNVVRCDGTTGVLFPEPSVRRVHRVAVALGGRRSVGYESKDAGKGFVHVLDEGSLSVLMTELDTIDDLLGYLRAKEAFIGEGREIAIEGGEEDLLAFYIQHQRSFPAEPDAVFIGAGGWEGLRANKYYQSRAEADRGSYLWDRLIEHVADSIGATVDGHTNGLENTERSIRVMAREDRLCRRALAEGVDELCRTPMKNWAKARMMPSPRREAVYVFLRTTPETERAKRADLLQRYCLVARLKTGRPVDVLGIATAIDDSARDQSVMVFCVPSDAWNADLEADAEWLLERGLGANFVESRKTHYNYPATQDGEGSD